MCLPDSSVKLNEEDSRMPSSWFGCFLLLTTAEWDDKEEGKDTTQQWEDDWDDDDVNDDFSLQLRKELENNAEKS